jgi:hypothetical protein
MFKANRDYNLTFNRGIGNAYALHDFLDKIDTYPKESGIGNVKIILPFKTTKFTGYASIWLKNHCQLYALPTSSRHKHNWTTMKQKMARTFVPPKFKRVIHLKLSI